MDGWLAMDRQGQQEGHRAWHAPHPSPPNARLAAGGPLPERLQEALLPVVSYERCTQPDWWGILAIRRTMICAGGAEKAGCNVSATPGWGGARWDPPWH